MVTGQLFDETSENLLHNLNNRFDISYTC